MIRNLIYHITPMGNWRDNIKQLLLRFDVFNGVKIVAIAVGEGLVDPEEVEKFFGDNVNDIICIRVENDKILRETASFAHLIDYLKANSSKVEDSITFYGHTKGVTHPANKAIKLWTRGCYKFNLEDIPEVERQLSWFPIVGSFKRYKEMSAFPPGGNNWYYSGTFFWFRNSAVFSKDWRGAIKDHRYGVEAWPSFMFKPTEGGVLFGDGVGDMYDLRCVRDLYKKEGVKWAE